MPLTQQNNLRSLELIKRMALFTDVNSTMSGVFRGVYTKNNNEWSLLLGALTLGDTAVDNNSQKCWHTYPNYQFVCKPIEGVGLAELMGSLNNDGCLPIPDIPQIGAKEDNPNWTESLIPSHASNGTFPLRRFSARLYSNVHCHDSKLVAQGMTFHSSAFEYVREFLGLDRFHGSSDGRKGELCIDIPDQRGHLILSNEDIRFHSETASDLSVVGAIDGDQVDLKSSQDKHDFEPEEALDIELWLVTRANEIVDYCSSSEWEYCYGTQTNSSDLQKLLDIIAAGESEHCEFKVYIDLIKKDTKACELEKTVCALSNHQGGKLFIGVDDETRIVGINVECQKGYKCCPDEAAERYQQAVDKRLQESLVKNQCFNTYLIEHDEFFVLVVDVHKANGLNYLLATNETHIRRGASSPKMTPSEIQAFPVERDALGRESFVCESSTEWGSY